MAASAPYQGLYINLDRSGARRAAIEARLAARGLGALYQRLPATDGELLPPAPPLTRGEVGCLRSHLDALRFCAERQAPTHIIEDDVVFARGFAPAATDLLASGLLDQYDLLFTDTFVHASVGAIRMFSHAFADAAAATSGFKLYDLAGRALAGATSYFVSARGARRALEAFTQEIKGPPRAPYDLYLRKFADERRLKIACLAPFLTSISLDDVELSTIGRRAENAQVHALLRASFFVDRDMADLQRRLDALTMGLAADPHRAFATQVLGYALAERGEAF